jgi:hypothetical protein
MFVTLTSAAALSRFPVEHISSVANRSAVFIASLLVSFIHAGTRLTAAQHYLAALFLQYRARFLAVALDASTVFVNLASSSQCLSCRCRQASRMLHHLRESQEFFTSDDIYAAALDVLILALDGCARGCSFRF